MSQSTFTNGSADENPDPQDVMKVLLATDIHLGFKEKEGIRREFWYKY